METDDLTASETLYQITDNTKIISSEGIRIRYVYFSTHASELQTRTFFYFSLLALPNFVKKGWNANGENET